MPRFMSKCKEENEAASLSESAFYFIERTFLYSKNPDTAILPQSGLEKLHFIRSIELSPERVAELREHNRVDRKIANQIASEIIRKHNRRIR